MPVRSRASLFLMEQLVVILVFALCAAACVRIFVDSYLMAQNSRDVRNALILAENVAECYKATGGDVARIAEILDLKAVTNAALPAEFYFDIDLLSCAAEGAAYVLTLGVPGETGGTSINVSNLAVSNREGDTLVSFPVAARVGR